MPSGGAQRITPRSSSAGMSSPSGSMSRSFTGPELKVSFVNDVSFVVETLIPELERLGVRTRLVGRRPADPSLRRGPYWKALFQAKSEIRRLRPYDIIHINYGLFGPVALGEAAAAVLHFHGSDIRSAPHPRNRLAQLVSRLSMHLADRIWYSTPDLQPFFRDMRIPHRYMPNPVSPGFLGVPEGPPEIREVLFAIPLSILKGAEAGIEAMRLLVRQRPDILVSAFGFGPNPTEAALLRRHIPPSVRLLPWTPHSDMPLVFSRASIVVGQLGGLGGILSITELEAMASSRPLVIGGQRKLTELESYYSEDPPLLSCRSPQDVVDTILALVDDPVSLRELGERGRKWITRYHSSSVVASHYVREYRLLLESRRMRA